MTFVVAGYSQGAHAAGIAVQELPERLHRRVVAAAWLGDPLFNAHDRTALSTFDDEHHGAMGARVLWDRVPTPMTSMSYCNLADPICNLTTMEVRGPHEVRFSRDLAWLWRTTRDLGIGVLDNHLNYYDADLASSPVVRDAIIRISNALGVTSDVVTTIPTDVAFVIDTTGAMAPAIRSVRDDVRQIVGLLAEQSPDFRVALVDHRPCAGR